MHRSYDLGDYLVGVRTNSELVGAWLDRHLGHARSSEEAEPYYSIMVADERGGRPGKRFHILYRETTALARSFDLGGVARTLFSELEGFLARGRDDAIYAELAPVSANGTLVLVPSHTVSYIDTLGGRVRKAGLTLPVATRTAIDPASGWLVPFEPLLPVHDAAFDELSDSGGGRGDGRFVLSEPAQVEVVCSVGTAEEPLRAVSLGAAVHQLATQVINLERLGSVALEGLTRLAAEARCCEIWSARAVDVLEALETAIRRADDPLGTTRTHPM